MIRPATPIMLLAEAPARQAPRTSVSGFDFAFMVTAALFIIGGCLFMLDMAAARSSGQESAALKILTDASVWLPALASATGKYLLLFLASVVNSALIVLLVQSLRTMDRRVSRLTLSGLRTSNKVENIYGKRAHLRNKRAHQRRETTSVRQSSPFLLSPVFR